MKRETAPSSESAQFILAWRSEDSVESAGSSQSEAQPGIGCSAIPEAAQSGGSKKPGARAYPKQHKTMRRRRRRKRRLMGIRSRGDVVKAANGKFSKLGMKGGICRGVWYKEKERKI